MGPSCQHRTIGSVESNPGAEVGIEIALTLFEQLERPLAKDQRLDVFYDSIRNITRTESLIVIQSSILETTIEFSHFDLEKKVAEKACSAGGLYSKMANIRFAHIYNENSSELRAMVPKGHPPINSLLSVPTQWRGKTTGCLALVNRIDEEPFVQADIMTLALGAMIVSFAREYKTNRMIEKN